MYKMYPIIYQNSQLLGFTRPITHYARVHYDSECVDQVAKVFVVGQFHLP